MSKKTIGLNPLEEYLSAPKNKRKEPQVKEKVEVAVKKVEKKPVEEPKKEVEAVQVQAEPQEQPANLTEGVEVDVQGQLAIKGTRVPEEKAQRPAKQRITLHISSELIDRVKNAVYWEPGLTVAGFAEEAFTKTIDALEEERGEPFPQRKHHRLRGGRPVS